MVTQGLIFAIERDLGIPGRELSEFTPGRQLELSGATYATFETFSDCCERHMFPSAANKLLNYLSLRRISDH